MWVVRFNSSAAANVWSFWAGPETLHSCIPWPWVFPLPWHHCLYCCLLLPPWSPSLPFSAVNIEASRQKNFITCPLTGTWSHDISVFYMNAYTLHLCKGTCVLIFQSSLSGIEDAVFKWASEIIKYRYWTKLSYHQCQIRNDMYDKSFLIMFQYSVTSLSPLVPPPPRPLFLLFLHYVWMWRDGWDSPGGICLSDKVIYLVWGPKPSSETLNATLPHFPHLRNICTITSKVGWLVRIRSESVFGIQWNSAPVGYVFFSCSSSVSAFMPLILDICLWKSFFSPSLHVEFVFLLLRLVLKDSYVVGSEGGWTGLGGHAAPLLSAFWFLFAHCRFPLPGWRSICSGM